MLPYGTPCSCSKVSDNVEAIRTLKDLSDKKFDIKFGNRPLKPISCKSFMMPYFHVVSYAFSRLKILRLYNVLFNKCITNERF